MRVVTWNLQHGVPDPVGPPDLAAGLKALQELDADVYALQELDNRRGRTGRVHQGQVIADAVGGALLWAPALRRDGGTYGNALVVRGTVVSSEVVRLPGRGEPRVAAVAQVQVAGSSWSVATPHLSLDHDTAQRQLLRALDALAVNPGPRVLLGDLNLTPMLVLPHSTAEGYTVVPGPFTINARKRPSRRLDHVLLQGAVAITSGVQKMPLSDHLAVWADLAPASGYRSSSSPLA